MSEPTGQKCGIDCESVEPHARGLPLGRLDHIDQESEHVAENLTSREAQTESARILLFRVLREGGIFCETAKRSDRDPDSFQRRALALRLELFALLRDESFECLERTETDELGHDEEIRLVSLHARSLATRRAEILSRRLGPPPLGERQV